jgi:hypothetical protein
MSQKNPFGSSAIPEDEEEDYAGGTSTPETVISLAASEELENSLFVLYCVCVCTEIIARMYLSVLSFCDRFFFFSA